MRNTLFTLILASILLIQGCQSFNNFTTGEAPALYGGTRSSIRIIGRQGNIWKNEPIDCVLIALDLPMTIVVETVLSPVYLIWQEIYLLVR